MKIIDDLQDAFGEGLPFTIPKEYPEGTLLRYLEVGDFVIIIIPDTNINALIAQVNYVQKDVFSVYALDDSQKKAWFSRKSGLRCGVRECPRHPGRSKAVVCTTKNIADQVAVRRHYLTVVEARYNFWQIKKALALLSETRPELMNEALLLAIKRLREDPDAQDLLGGPID